MKNTRRLQIAVVTGASSGMGRETVIQLADRFACLDEIWVLARRKDRLIQLERQVPVRLRIFETDITREEDFNQFGNVLQKESPHIRFLVNAAGYGKTGRAGQIDWNMEHGTGNGRLKLQGAPCHDPDLPPLSGQGRANHRVCVCRRFSASAWICRICSIQSLCIKL